MPLFITEDHFHVLRKIDSKQSDHFRYKHGRRPTLNDQVAKHQEEIGELLTAVKRGETTERLVDEFWDTIFSDLACGFRLGFTDDELQRGLELCLLKLAERVNLQV